MKLKAPRNKDALHITEGQLAAHQPLQLSPNRNEMTNSLRSQPPSYSPLYLCPYRYEAMRTPAPLLA